MRSMFEDDPFRDFRLEHSPVLLKDGKDGFALHICAQARSHKRALA